MKYWILWMICISTTYATLNGNCTDDNGCSSVDNMKCKNGKCACDTPWYIPCNSSACITQKKISNEGDQCRNSDNCLANAMCNTTEKRCRCNPGFASAEGLCYKSLNSSCGNSDECWSRECRESRCQCPARYNRKDSNRCTVTFAKTYVTWSLANQTSDFCHSHISCRDPSAICQNDSIHYEKFCQCPWTHHLNKDEDRCEWRVYAGLSPSITPSSNETCGKCKVPNAICVPVGKQTTCWCRATFEAEGNKCNKKRLHRLFPSQKDLSAHNYSTNCSVYGNTETIQNENGLCACAPGYEFATAKSSCQRIKRPRINEKLEYGVCTKINSRGVAVQDQGLCPWPLTCEAREDKHVCSCGQDRFYDDEANACYPYLNRVVTNTTCPMKNTILEGSQCRCKAADVYLTDDIKTCELKLNATADSKDSICSSTVPGDAECVESFHGYAKFCKLGECRCMSENSFAADNKCITFINSKVTANSRCPENAIVTNGTCRCADGFRAASTNKSCVELKISLHNSTDPPEQDSNENITLNDCHQRFPRQYLELSNNTCRCREGTIESQSKCIFQLDHTFPNDIGIDYNCPNFAFNQSEDCRCELGYKNEDNYTCVAEQKLVHEHDSIMNCTGENVTDDICKKLFGNAAEFNESTGCCRCQSSEKAFGQDNRCYFLIDVNQTQPVHQRDCPPTSKNETEKCVCPPYHPTDIDQRKCVPPPSILFVARAIDPATAQPNASCSHSACETLYGPGRICNGTTCYCDRTRSFVRNNTCELYTDYVFPGAHDRYAYACDTVDDCGSNAKENGIECDFQPKEDFKVCKCQQGFYLNPAEEKCVNNLCGTCGDNEQCQDYACVCKPGYHRDASTKCVLLDMTLNLYDQCNRIVNVSEPFQCSIDCGHLECAVGYHDDHAGKCVNDTLSDRCARDPGLCTRLSLGATCNFDENRCTCSAGYYQPDKQAPCVRTVGSSCATSLECGALGTCESEHCRCVDTAKEVASHDSYGREITICAEKSNVEQFRSHPVFILILLCIHLVFA